MAIANPSPIHDVEEDAGGLPERVRTDAKDGTVPSDEQISIVCRVVPDIRAENSYLGKVQHRSHLRELSARWARQRTE